MGDVVLGAVGFVGLVMIAAAVAGLLVGLVVVIRKRLRDRGAGPTDPGHARLRSWRASESESKAKILRLRKKTPGVFVRDDLHRLIEVKPRRVPMQLAARM